MLQSAAKQSPIVDDIAVRMMPVVRRIAFKMARRLPRHISIDELIGAGSLGLACACAHFDPERAEEFSAYAETRIRGAMLDELRSVDPLSRDQRAFANRVAAAKRALGQTLGREPSAAEIAEHLQIPLAEYWAHAARTQHGVTLGLDDDRDEPIEVRDAAVVPADERLVEEQSRRVARAALQALPPRLRQVVGLYYAEDMTLRQIGVRLGVSESRVCQLLAEATQRTRAQVESVSGSGDDARAPKRGGAARGLPVRTWVEGKKPRAPRRHAPAPAARA